MFTGIVTHKAPVTSAEISEFILRLILSTQDGFTDRLTTGASISVNGVCLTVVAFDANTVAFDVIDESLRLTNLSDLKSTHLVNLERPPLSGTRLGGICSQGISKLKQRSPSMRRITTSSRSSPSIPSKICHCEGHCSQRMQSYDWPCQAGSFSLHLIPETLRLTNLENATPGTKFNIEFDHQTMTIVETVERVMASRQ